MPYISQGLRQNFEPNAPRAPLVTGELNYQITRLCWRYITNNGVSYTTLNEVIGVLECAKLELYRRQLAPYEDRKCEENGDVYQDKGLYENLPRRTNAAPPRV